MTPAQTDGSRYLALDGVMQGPGLRTDKIVHPHDREK